MASSNTARGPAVKKPAAQPRVAHSPTPRAQPGPRPRFLHLAWAESRPGRPCPLDPIGRLSVDLGGTKNIARTAPPKP